MRAVDGQVVCPYITGGEAVVAHNCTDIFAAAAEADGKVTEVSDKHIRVEYTDSEIPALTVELGRRYGVSAGVTIPHDIMTDLKVGDKVSKDHVISWNKGFFARLPISRTQVYWKSGVMVDVAFLESPGTFEDSCEISPDVNKLMVMNSAEVRTIEARGEQTIHRLVSVGDEVEADSILCNVEDPVTAVGDLFSEKSLDTLRTSARNSPRSRHVGTIGAIEVLYNLDLDDETETISDSIRKLIAQADKARLQKVRMLKDGDATTGYVPQDLEPGVVLIKIYIDSRTSAGDGDKFVFANQMKSVSRQQMFGTHETKSGKKIGAYFAYTSADNRQVNSPQIIGTTVPLVEESNRRAAKAYRS